MGINLYNVLWGDYTLCIEILNTEYFLWNKSKISVDELTSAGIRNPTFSVKKFRYNYKDEKNHPKIIYHHRLIVNFYKSASSPRNFLHILVNIPLSLLNSYPSKFTGTYIIAYGIQGRATDVDADKVYDLQHLISNQQTFHTMLTLMRIKKQSEILNLRKTVIIVWQQ